MDEDRTMLLQLTYRKLAEDIDVHKEPAAGEAHLANRQVHTLRNSNSEKCNLKNTRILSVGYSTSRTNTRDASLGA